MFVTILKRKCVNKQKDMKIYCEICVREVVGSYGKNSHNLNSYTQLHKCYSRQPNSQTPHISFLIILIQNVSVAYIYFLFLSFFLYSFLFAAFSILKKCQWNKQTEYKDYCQVQELGKVCFWNPNRQTANIWNVLLHWHTAFH